MSKTVSLFDLVEYILVVFFILARQLPECSKHTILYYSLIKLIIETSYGIIQNASKAFTLPSYSSCSYQ
jgi:hypothetical protein